jgi:hypothetical protein
LPGLGLLSEIICDKFVYLLPFYRQVQRYEKLRMKIPASTLDGWFEAACALLEPLYDALKAQVFSSSYIQCDETPIRVLDKQKKGETHRGYHWVYHSPESKMVLFDYREARGREGPKELLKNYRGYLQTDGYGVYEWTSNARFDRQVRLSLRRILSWWAVWLMPADTLNMRWIMIKSEQKKCFCGCKSCMR